MRGKKHQVNQSTTPNFPPDYIYLGEDYLVDEYSWDGLETIN